MAWKATGKPTVQKQRDRFVVRVDGIDTQTGKRRPRQLGSYSSKRAAQTAALEFTAARDVASDRRTVGELVERTDIARWLESWAASRVHEWAARHIGRTLGGIRIDQLGRRAAVI
jgi:hypothetical protein